ncbi:aldolase catalytic domain-containing protein [Trichlorobacter lovleyi]|uniref:aldolase catalytic domain-containing protein n=1 Tax=Trichlorobacter lovleyi TaxID=313985 RepID=UPI0023F0E8A8|nr:aldolase catalytic domain-containing protein [Trichlorobacter lovleyi]
MKSIQILDCTLRDGGFVNDWNFGLGSMKSIISRLDKAGVDMVEIGFIDERRSYDPNRAIQPDTQSFQAVLQGLDIRNSLILGMVDYGTCDIDKIAPKEHSYIDGIRVIFKKKDQDAALRYLQQIKAKGYKIYVNPVSITGYSDEEICSLIGKINGLDPEGVSIVDTYGLMHRKDLLHYFRLFDKYLSNHITLGYHAHNNFQLVYANSIELCELLGERNIIIDSSLYGMGKGAGNANTELIAMYYNENINSKYEVEHLLEAIDVDILKEYAKAPWGYSLSYYLAASNDCHPDYAKYLLSKKTLAVKSVNELLTSLPVTHKLAFNRELIERLYVEYQDVACNDAAAYRRLAAEITGRKVLLIGPGASIVNDADAIMSYIKQNSPVLISINFINDMYPIDYVFMGNSKRYSQFFHNLHGTNRNAKIITTSNITASGEHIDFVFNYGKLLDETDVVRDNPLLMMLNILTKLGCVDVTIAGFDGYDQNVAQNYYDQYIPFLYCHDNVLLRNSAIANKLKVISKDMSIRSITKTLYL